MSGNSGISAPSREVFLHFSVTLQVIFYVVAATASFIFCLGFYRRYRKYRRGRPDYRFDNLGRRISGALYKIARNETVRRGDALAGVAHSLIFWGFTVLFIGTCLVALDHDVLPLLGMKLLQGPFYLGFSATLDLFGAIFIIGLILMIVRRAFLRPSQLDYARADPQGGHVDRSGYATDDMIFVWLLFVIAVTGFLVEGLRIAQTMPNFERWSPIGWALASTVAGGNPDILIDTHLWAWWIHAIFVMAFIAYIPYSKMMHIFTDAANLVFADERAGRCLPGLPSDAGADGKDVHPIMGYTRITDFTWKELLDLDACTKCGRCHVACPAQAAGTTLSPRDVILDLRSFANDALATPEWLNQKFRPGSKWPLASTGGRRDPGGVDVAVEVIRSETLWSCTTCRACMEVCPVGIEHLTSIVQMRRHLVDRGQLDDNLQRALMNLGDYGNSFGESPKKRSRWTKDLSFKIKDARREKVDYLWFVGDFASFDPRLQAISRLVAEVLNRAGVDFGILHDRERNAGNDVRRVGEEGLFEMLVEENLKVLEGARFREILTTDPHTLNTLRNEYPAFGAAHPVRHYTELLARLIRDGRLTLTRRLAQVVTYHDPCYLARYNREVDAPREVLTALGVELREMPRCGVDTFCCGAGGGRIWMDTSNEQQRASEQRIEEALRVGGVRVFVTTCPKDYTMYSDAVKNLGRESQIEVKDLIELVVEAQGVVKDGSTTKSLRNGDFP